MNEMCVDPEILQRIRKRKRELEESNESSVIRVQKITKISVSNWKEITAENLRICYLDDFLAPKERRLYFENLEREIAYLTGDLVRIRLFGKYHDVPRKQAAYGDSGLKYTFSGCTVSAMPWTPTLLKIKSHLEEVVPLYKYNFCLVNRYKNGKDYMGEHRDDEKELDAKTPIASVSLGQHRDFIFRHKDTRVGNVRRKIERIKILLSNGSLLLMNEPTNTYWYHSLPQRKKLPGVRINLTFRKIIQ